MLNKQFFKNVLPAMLAFAFSGVYAIVDGWFVGQNVGDLGLAAVNIAYPLTALIQAVGTGIGMGGAILLGIRIGQEDQEGQKSCMGNTLILLCGACAVTTVVLTLCTPALLRLFGAQGEVFRYAADYMRVIALGASLQILATGLVPVIRNYNGALAAMGAMIAGFLTNVVLDWLFIRVLGYATTGAAAATLIGQTVTAVPCFWFLQKSGKLFGFASLRPAGKAVRELLAVAVSPFGLTFSPNLVVVILNKGAILYGGQSAAACYAVISYVVCIIQLLMQGVGDGSQPLISRFYGLQEWGMLGAIRRRAYLFGFSVALVCGGGMLLLRSAIPQFFGVSDQVAAAIEQTLPIFVAGFGFVAFLRITTSYFYAVQQNRCAYLLIYGEPVLLLLLALFLLPPLWDLSGVWLAVPVSQGILSLAGVFLRLRERREKGFLQGEIARFADMQE